MPGTEIKITVRDAQLQAAFRLLREKDGGLVRAALVNIGQQMVKSTRARFAAGTDPSGAAWAKLNPEYAKGKRGTKILQEAGMRGGLMGSITYRVAGSSVEWGTNKIYGAIHQFGGTIRPRSGEFLVFRLGGKTVFAHKVTIPKRSYLGVSETDRQTILDVISDHIRGAWES